MASEVISQLAGVAGEIKRNRTEPEVYQALLDEWNEHFPPSLGTKGSPKAIAALLAKQSAELNDLRGSLDKEKSKREKDVAEILQSMDAQLQAYKASVISERKHQQLLEQHQYADQEQQRNELERTHKEKIETLQITHARELDKRDKMFQSNLNDALATIKNLEKNMRKNQQGKDSAILEEQKKYLRLERKYDSLKTTHKEFLSNLSDDFSVLDPTDDDDDDGDKDDNVLDKERSHPLLCQSHRNDDKEELLTDEQKQRIAERKRKKYELLERLKNSNIGKNNSGGLHSSSSSVCDSSAIAAAATNQLAPNEFDSFAYKQMLLVRKQ